MSSENSTNVRSSGLTSPAWLRSGIAALDAVSPQLAAAFVERLFLRTPERRPDSKREYSVLLAAQRSRVAFEGESLALYRWGEGPRVLLLHGWGGSAGQLTPFVPALLAAGFSVAAFDAPGHGASTGNWLAMPRYADAIARVAAEIGPLHGAVAHSLGAPALSLAVKRGLPVPRAVFVGPPADALAWFLDFARSLALSDALTAAARARIERRAGASLADLNARAFGPSLRMPLLVVHDRQDREVVWDDGAAVAATAARAELHTTEGLGHRRILRDAAVIERSVAFIAGARRAELPAATNVIELYSGAQYRTSA